MRIALLLILIPSVAWALPFLVSDLTEDTRLTHCAFYFDGDSLAERAPVGVDDDGLSYCLFDLEALSPGTHTVRAAFQIDDPTWGITEGPQSDPFEFIKPGAFDPAMPVPVLRIEINSP